MATEAREQEGIAVPGETKEEIIQLKDEEIVQEQEEEAYKHGWRPIAEFHGSKGEFVSAKEFLLRKPMLDRIGSQSVELTKLKKSIKAMVSQHQTQVDAQVKLRLHELKSAKTEAIEAGDVNQVAHIDAETDQLKETAKNAPKVPDEVSEWVTENPWFNSDKEMNAWAIAHNKACAANNPTMEVADTLAETAKAIKKAFPEKFEQPKPKVPPSPTEGGSGPKDTSGKKNYSTKRLSDDQRLVYNQLVKTHKTLTHDDYFAGLEEIGELA